MSDTLMFVAEHVPRIVETIPDILAQDPLKRYLLETEDRKDNIFTRASFKFSAYADMGTFAGKKTGYVIDNGDAHVCFSDPAKPTSRANGYLLKLAGWLYGLSLSKEQTKRLKEMQVKYRAAIKEFLGEYGGDMFSIEHVGAIPAKQGHGYGTTLCKLVVAEADSRRLKTYLVSSNRDANTEFYNRLGFFAVKKFVLGEQNPTWREAPVVIEIMIRDGPNLAEKQPVDVNLPKDGKPFYV
ncbi:hypothetical protein BXZ70DRAFT_412533 [Cristinia sonorae]|uniref:N-acetyltransferase domain-containing protein n=1 Tax=Cristinia sonorae TaxID=1940300 RepID=A0A8K0XTP5_9AGAR|nr:hypothetical protein BXZ70DRAFT_412533 [Cristinia sonorae]